MARPSYKDVLVKPAAPAPQALTFTVLARLPLDEAYAFARKLRPRLLPLLLSTLTAGGDPAALWRWACACGLLDVVKWLHGNRVASCYPEAVFDAVGGPNLQVLRFLVENGINKANVQQVPFALMRAVYLGRIEAFLCLCSWGGLHHEVYEKDWFVLLTEFYHNRRHTSPKLSAQAAFPRRACPNAGDMGTGHGHRTWAPDMGTSTLACRNM
jgi:hypothetical protein